MTRRFVVGTAIGLSLFIIINLSSAHFSSDCGLPAVFGWDACADDIARAGWPFNFYEEGGFAYRYHFEPFILALDLGIALALSAAVSWLASHYLKTLPK